ncbi:MAG: hypothetical protein J07HX64_02444 [halophilic archaeon J07HX64]|nr:MAG: hypothetical protein J07HX64_02444 [halophilic archaeon J07HX64]
MTGRTDRRGFLCALAAVGAASAGCLSLGSDDAPSYADWVPATDDGFFFAYLELGVTEGIDDGSGLLPVLSPLPSGGGERPVRIPDELDSVDDPLFSLPFRLSGLAFLNGSLNLRAAGLGGLLEREEGTTVSELFALDGVVMGTGEFDTDELDRRLRDTDDSRGYEFVEESNGYRYYEPPEGPGTEPLGTIAVGESMVALGEDRENIVQLLETVSGERERAVDGLDGFDRLVDSAGDGDILSGWYGFTDTERGAVGDEQFLPGELGSEENVITAARFAPGGNEITVELTVQSDSLSPDRRETLETTFGGGEASTSLADGRFSANRTYDEIPFEPLGTDPTDDLPSGEDLPPEIREAVPEGAVEIYETSEGGRYRVEVTEPVQVDELTIRAIEADSEFIFPNPGEGTGGYVHPQHPQHRQ